MTAHSFRHIRLLLALLLALCCANIAAGQRHTSVRGRVTDAQTGEALPFVQIFFAGTNNGTISDDDGHFFLSNEVGDTIVLLKMVGYKTDTLVLHYGKSVSGKKISLRQMATELNTVTIKPKGKKDKYSRRDNPAVELVKNVISHKHENAPEGRGDYSRTLYDKTTMALDNFHPNFHKHKLWKHLPFVEKYIDTTEFDETEILNISITESMLEQEYTSNRQRTRTLTTARRIDGVNLEVEVEDMNRSVAALFAPVDIYSDVIDLVSNQFISPLSENLAVAYYHYYITDTIEEEGHEWIELSFAPARKESYGFMGQMYISCDGRYAVKRLTMKVSAYANVNFVRDLTVMQTFERDSAGFMLPLRSDTYGRMYLGKRLQQVYIHQLRHFSDYRFGDSILRLEDSIFSVSTNTATLPTANKVRRKEWNSIRPIELRWQETVLDSFRYELMRTPGMKALVHTAEILATGYIYTNSNHDTARFAIGPIYNFVSNNSLEGYRLRLGGRSTASLSRKNFVDGYVAYGFNDRRFKGSLNLTHTFAEKRRHAYEGPLGLIVLSGKYDVESPGLSFEQYDPDNLLMQTVSTRIMQYTMEGKLRLRKQWGAFTTDSWIATQHYEPANALSYYRYANDGTMAFVNGYWNNELSTKWEFTPNKQEKNSRDGKRSSMTQRDRFSISLDHTMGLFDGFYYNTTNLQLRKDLWMAPLGNIEFLVTAGKVWNTVPLPKLIIPNGNASVLMSENAFNTMMPLEFIVDQQVSLFATYHMRGLVLSHIPVIKRFKWREVFSFNMLYGGLTDKNNPASKREGLFAFPSMSGTLGAQPFAEYSIGVENILKVIRIDYVSRLTYKENATLVHGWRLGLKVTL